MSGTSAGARRGWKTRTGQLPPVGYGRTKNPRRVQGGRKSKQTREFKKQDRSIARSIDNLIARYQISGKLSGAEADAARYQNQRDYEYIQRMRSRRSKGRGR